MQVSERRTITCGLEELVQLLSHVPPSWLFTFLRIAAHEGEARAIGERPGPSAGGGEPRVIEVELGSAEVLPDQAAAVGFPIRWSTKGYRLVFSELTGRVILRRVSPLQTEVEITGCYDAPRDVIDDVLAHRAAKGSVRNLLDNLGIAIEERVTEIV